MLKSKQFPFWYLSTVVEEYRYKGWAQQAGQYSRPPYPSPASPGLGARASVQAQPQWGSSPLLG